MNKRITSIFLSFVMIFNLSIISVVYADGKPIFVDKYNYEVLTNSSVSYDFNFDGNIDTLSTNVYPTYSESMGDYCARYEFVINNNAYHIVDRRHGSYTDLFITDINQTDNYLDIVLIDWYKGISAEIYRYNGNSLISLTSDIYDADDNYFNVWGGYWDAVKNGGNTEPNVDMQVSVSNSGVIGFSFLCSEECHNYIKQSELCYTETDDPITIQADNIEPFTGLPETLNLECGSREFITLNRENINLEFSDNTVAEIGEGLWVDQTGMMDFSIVPKNPGETILTAIAPDGSMQQCRIKVTAYVNVVINSNIITFDCPAMMTSDRTLVPLRGIFENMGANVDWDEDTQTVTSILDLTIVQLTIGSNILYKNGQLITLDVPAQLITHNNQDYTMVPVRAVAEAFGAEVEWDNDTYTVYIKTAGNTYSMNIVPSIICDGYDANFADFNGMYIDSFTHSTNADGSENLKFNVYNTTYIYGAVEVYDSNGKLKDAAVIQKMSDETSIKGVMIDNVGKIIRDIKDGEMLTYRQETGYSKKTPISVDVPKGGYIKISNAANASLTAAVINSSDVLFGLRKIYKGLKGFNADSSAEYTKKLTAELVKNAVFCEMTEDPYKYTDALCKGITKEFYMKPSSVGEFTETISKNLDELADGELVDLMLSTASSCGVSIAESTFEKLSGPAGIALKGLFSFSKLTNELMEVNDLTTYMYNESIKIKTFK